MLINFVYFSKSDVSTVQGLNGWNVTLGEINKIYFKVIQGHWIWGTNRKRVCDFQLVRNSNLGPILHRFGDFADVLLTPPLFHPNFGGVPIAPDRPCWGCCEQGPWAIWPFIYFRRIPTCAITVPKLYGRTDGRTDGQTTCDLTALCVASRGKNWTEVMCYTCSLLDW